MKGITNLNIFETNILDGPMKLKYDYFPEITGGVSRHKITDDMTEEMKEEFVKLREKAGKRYGFDGMKIIVPCEEDSLNVGDYFVADDAVYDMDDDLWNIDIPGDIVVLKNDNPGIAVAYPVADDPVLVVEDRVNGAVALTHCNVDRISAKMPVFAVKALQKEVGSSVPDLKVYIGTHLKRESNIVLRRPRSVVQNKEIWKKCISRKSGNKNKRKKVKNVRSGLSYFLFKGLDKISYRIDQEKAIINMLVKYGVDKDNIVVSESNSFTDASYFSDRKASMFREDLLKGKFLVGAYYSNTIEEYDNKCPYTGQVLTRKL